MIESIYGLVVVIMIVNVMFFIVIGVMLIDLKDSVNKIKKQLEDK